MTGAMQRPQRPRRYFRCAEESELQTRGLPASRAGLAGVLCLGPPAQLTHGLPALVLVKALQQEVTVQVVQALPRRTTREHTSAGRLKSKCSSAGSSLAA